MTDKNLTDKAYSLAKEQYRSVGVDTDRAIEMMNNVIISIHCWQTDDVRGFEKCKNNLSDGIKVTGNYPGRATTINEVKTDLEKVMSLVPGKQRINLHAIYGDFGDRNIDRNAISIEHYQTWIDWCKKLNTGLDFNPTFFSHPLAESGFTLSSKNETIRKFWIEHLLQSRFIASEIGRQLKSPCIHNIWIPDGSKDIPIDRNGHREILKKSLDEVFATKLSKSFIKDALESKLFGVGLESMTVGSHDFYLGYAVRNNLMICLDNGHFHPTEQIGDKISSCLQFLDQLLLHLTRPVRWDSDHVVTLNDDILLIASEIVRNNFLNRIHLGLDFFDASLNRVGAYVIGVRALQKAFLWAFLEPVGILKSFEEKGKYFERLAFMEELKTKLFGAVWDYYCQVQNVPVGHDYFAIIQKYEQDVLQFRKEFPC